MRGRWGGEWEGDGDERRATVGVVAQETVQWNLGRAEIGCALHSLSRPLRRGDIIGIRKCHYCLDSESQGPTLARRIDVSTTQDAHLNKGCDHVARPTAVLSPRLGSKFDPFTQKLIFSGPIRAWNLEASPRDRGALSLWHVRNVMVSHLGRGSRASDRASVWPGASQNWPVAKTIAAVFRTSDALARVASGARWDLPTNVTVSPFLSPAAMVTRGDHV